MKRIIFAGALVAALIVVMVGFRAGGARLREASRSTDPSREGGTMGSAAGARRGAPLSPPMRPIAAKTVTLGQVVVQGAYGANAGEFGRRRDPESNPEGPMAVAAGPGGQLAVVNEINRRILRYKDGKLTGTIAIGGDTVQDLAFAKDGKLLVLDRLVDGNVQVYGADGKLTDELSLGGKGVPEGGGVTGLFADDDGIYVERDHEAVIRIADASGKANPNRQELVGRPSRDGHLLLSAAIGDPLAGEIVVSAVERASGQPAWQQTLRLGVPVVHIVTLDSDRQGMIYLATDVGREAPTPPYPIVDERIVISRLGAGGVPRGLLEVPPLPTADESFRPITVDDDGAIFVMAAGDSGLSVTRYVFP